VKPIHIAVAMGLVAAGCDSESGFPDARIPDASPTPGTFSLSWTVTDTNDASAITSDEANATNVTVTVRREGAGTATPESFNCNNGMATSPPYLPGDDYVLGFELRGPTGAIATAPTQTGIVITSGQDTPIGGVDFAVDAIGAVTLNISAVTAMDNCGPIAMMGGGIDQMTLTLTRGTTCVPFEYTIGAGPVTTTCPATPVACIERDVDVVAAMVDSGRYQVEAVGLIGTAECWVGAREIRVPTDGGSATFPLSMAYQPLVAGCPPMP
jgi:hypothetical protein